MSALCRAEKTAKPRTRSAHTVGMVSCETVWEGGWLGGEKGCRVKKTLAGRLQADNVPHPYPTARNVTALPGRSLSLWEQP